MCPSSVCSTLQDGRSMERIFKALVVIAGLNIVIEVSGEDQKAMAAELVAKKSASLLGALLSKLEHIGGASAPKHAASSSSSIALGTT